MHGEPMWMHEDFSKQTNKKTFQLTWPLLSEGRINAMEFAEHVNFLLAVTMLRMFTLRDCVHACAPMCVLSTPCNSPRTDTSPTTLMYTHSCWIPKQGSLPALHRGSELFIVGPLQRVSGSTGWNDIYGAPWARVGRTKREGGRERDRDRIRGRAWKKEGWVY